MYFEKHVEKICILVNVHYRQLDIASFWPTNVKKNNFDSLKLSYTFIEVDKTLFLIEQHQTITIWDLPM